MKIISYALWGNDRRYVDPLMTNIKVAEELFPDWKVVVYISGSTTKEVKDELKSLGADVYECGESPDTRGAFWRFRALSLPDADVVIIRDADSALTVRDKSMVEHWIASDRDFYLCRDHPFHVRPIICCSWGAKGKGIEKIKNIADYDPGYSNYGDDEKFLAQFVYLKYRKEFLVFAPFLLYRGERNEELNLRRVGKTDYIGRIVAGEDCSEDAAMEALWNIDCPVPVRRWLIPYSKSWNLIHWLARNVIRKKSVQEWRDFSVK